MKSLVLFNSTAFVGKTTLTFNVAHMAARLGWVTVLLDLDPQCDLTALLLQEKEHEPADSWDPTVRPWRTVVDYIEDVREGNWPEPELREVGDRLWLLPGALALGRFEAHGLPVAMAQIAERAAARVSADLVMVDLGSNLGALNQTALLGCDAVVVPVTPDPFGLEGLATFGPTLREWNVTKPLGYVVTQYLARVEPRTARLRWAAHIPSAYHEHVLGDAIAEDVGIDDDAQCIAHLEHFASLVPLAQLARKPLFDLKKADGVMGRQVQTVAKAHVEFEVLTRSLMSQLDLPPP